MSSPLARKTLAVTLAAAALQLVMVIAFAWPASRTAPRDVPLVLAGPRSAEVADRLTRAAPGAFEITKLADEAAARQALTDREAYGAILTTPAGPRLLVASAASPAVAQQLSHLAEQLAASPAGQGAGTAGASAGGVVSGGPVQDVVPAGPKGNAFGSLALPLVMSGIAAGVLLTLVISSVAWRLAGLVGFALLGGLGFAALAQGWLAILNGSYLAVAGVVGLAILAVTGTVVGLAAVIGRPGIGVAALTLLLLGNPLSAAASAPELLPEPWGALGQLLPPGAAVSALRSVGYFDGAALAGPLMVLLSWGAAAVVLLGIGARRGRTQAAPVPAAEPAMAA